MGGLDVPIEVERMSIIRTGFCCDRCGKLHSYGRLPVGLVCDECGATMRDPHAAHENKSIPKRTYSVWDVAVGVIVLIVFSFVWGNVVGFGSSEGPDYCDVSFCR